VIARLIFFFLIGCTHTLAQTAPNPFDLLPRITPSDTAYPASSLSDNPFDIAQPSQPIKPGASPQTTPKREPAIPTLTPDEQFKAFLFTITVIILTLLTLLITIFRSIYQHSYRAFLNENILNQLLRESQQTSQLPSIIPYAFFFINAGTLLFLINKYYGYNYPDGLWQGWGLITGAITLLFIVKHLVLSLFAYIFPVEKEVAAYNFTIIIFGIILSIVMVPANVFIAYGPLSLTKAAILITFGILLLAYAFRSLRALIIANNFLLSNKFHFFLYLCTVEIVPVLVIIKWLQRQILF